MGHICTRYIFVCLKVRSLGQSLSLILPVTCNSHNPIKRCAFHNKRRDFVKASPYRPADSCFVNFSRLIHVRGLCRRKHSLIVTNMNESFTYPQQACSKIKLSGGFKKRTNLRKKHTELIYHMPRLYQCPPLPFYRSYKN